MKNLIYLLFVLALIFSDVYAQSENLKDSLSAAGETNNNLRSESSFYIGDNFFRITPRTFLTDINPFAIDDPSTIMIRTKLAFMNNGLPYGKTNSPNNLLQPYYELYLQKRNIGLLQKVLGMAQLGAVGYLAYKHLKKYGLFH